MNAFVISLNTRDERLNQFKKIDFPFKVNPHIVEKNIDGSLGCIISHLDCFSKFDDGINLIFEDDCIQINDIDVMFKAIEELGDNWDVLYLGAMVHGVLKQNTIYSDIVTDAWTTHAIAYNGRKVSDFILNFSPEEIRRQRRNIDTFIVHNIQKNPMFKCYITNPQIFIQDLNYSDVINDIRDYKWKYGERI